MKSAINLISVVEGLLQLRIKSAKYEHMKAQCYAWLGDYEKALEMLEIASKKKDLYPELVYVIQKMNKDIPSDPRYIAIKNMVELGNY